MEKKQFDVNSAWKTVCEDELALKRSRARKLVLDPLVCILFIVLTVLLTLVAYYMLVVEQVMRNGCDPMEIPLLWQINGWVWVKLLEVEEVTMVAYFAAIVIPFVVCVAIGMPCRLISKLCAKLAIRENNEPLTGTYLEQLETLNRKIAALQQTKTPKWGIVTCFGILAGSLLGCAICLVVGIPGKLSTDQLLVVSFVLQGMQFGASVLLGFFTRLISFSRRPYPNYDDIAYDAARALKAEQKAEKERREERERMEAFNKGAEAFFAGDYKTAKTILQKIHLKDSADAEALVLLSSEKKDQSIDGIRKTYGQLWNAWGKGFRDKRVREATKTALALYIVAIDEAAQPDMLKAFACFLAQDWRGASRALEPHVKYNYPDAVALDIVCRTMDDRNDPDKYPDWLKALKTAKQRQISEMYIEVCDELIGKLEVSIRQNEERKKRAAEERRRRESSYTLPSFGGIPSWAEPSGWTDFRTGEPLYRVDGRIVNANGEEVSVAWWD